MSAYICNETHIATCAAMVAEHVRQASNRDVADIARSLARENLASVMHRYSDDFRMLPSNAEGDGERYVERCGAAAPLPCSPAEGFSYLECLEYQSCEHHGWGDSEACGWIAAATEALTLQMRDELLDGRDVWEVGGTPVPVDEPFLCNPQHIATCAAVLCSTEIFALRGRHSTDIAAFLARANMTALGYRADEGAGDAVVANGMTVSSYIAACERTMPVIGTHAENYNRVACLRAQCAAGPDGPQSETVYWIDACFHDLAWNMRSQLLQGASVFQAPYVPPGTDAAPTP